MPLLPVSRDLTNRPYKLAVYAIIGVFLLILYGVIGSTYIMRLDLINSIYFTVQTIATVGFGDIQQLLFKKFLL